MARMILLLRPLEESLNSAKALQKLGFTPVILPLSKPIFSEEKPDFNGFDALIFTSARALEAFDTITLPCFVVGEKTRDAVLFRGASSVTHSHTGEALALKLNALPFQNFYWGAGATTAFDLITACPLKNIHKQRLYSMKLVENLPVDLPSTVTTVLHYSAETAKRLVQLAPQVSTLSHLCLSARIAENLPFPKVFSAKEPTEAALFSLLHHNH